MQTIRGAIGAFFIVAGFAVQVLAFLLYEAGWQIERAGCWIWERPCPPRRATPPL